MPKLAYRYFTLNQIGWKGGGEQVVSEDTTTCEGEVGAQLRQMAGDGGADIDLSAAALVNAAWTVGLYPDGWVEEEMLWRASSLLAGLTTKDGMLIPAPLAQTFAAPEEAALSDVIGQTFCAVVAGAAGACFFMPLARAKTAGFTATPVEAGQDEPDFISLTLGKNGLVQLQAWAATQLGSESVLQTLNGEIATASHLASLTGYGTDLAPNAKIGAVSQIQDDQWLINVADPAGPFPTALGAVPKFALYQEFYRPVRVALTANKPQVSQQRYANAVFNTVLLPPTNTRYGMDSAILKVLNDFDAGKTSREKAVDTIEARLAAGYPNPAGSQMYASETGVLTGVTKSWFNRFDG